jgi:hypothetical protein
LLLYFFCVCCVNFAIVFLYFCLVLWRYLDSCLPDLLLGFNLETFVLKFTGGRFARGSPHSILLAFSQFYEEHDRKNKIVVPFFC